MLLASSSCSVSETGDTANVKSFKALQGESLSEARVLQAISLSSGHKHVWAVGRPLPGHGKQLQSSGNLAAVTRVRRCMPSSCFQRHIPYCHQGVEAPAGAELDTLQITHWQSFSKCASEQGNQGTENATDCKSTRNGKLRVSQEHHAHKDLQHGRPCKRTKARHNVILKDFPKAAARQVHTIRCPGRCRICKQETRKPAEPSLRSIQKSFCRRQHLARAHESSHQQSIASRAKQDNVSGPPTEIHAVSPMP